MSDNEMRIACLVCFGIGLILGTVFSLAVVDLPSWHDKDAKVVKYDDKFYRLAPMELREVENDNPVQDDHRPSPSTREDAGRTR